MKAFKAQSSESVNSTTSTRSYDLDKRLIVFPSVKNSSGADWMVNCKKRKVSRVLHLPTTYNSKMFKTIIKQNSKYVKSIKPCLYNDIRAISHMKQIKGLRQMELHSHLNIMSNYSRFRSSMSLFRGFFNLSSLSLISPLSKLTFVKDLVLKFPEKGYHSEFLFDLLKELSDFTEIHSLQLKLNLSKLPKRRFNLQHIMIKFTKLKKLTLNLDIDKNEDCGYLFTSLLPLNKLKQLNVRIHSTNSINCDDLKTFIESLNLSTLNIYFRETTSEQLRKLSKSVRNNPSIKSFTIGQDGQTLNDFSNENLVNIIEDLNSLKTIRLDLNFNLSNQHFIIHLMTYFLEFRFLENLFLSLKADTQIEILPEFIFCVSDLSKKLTNFNLKIEGVSEDIAQLISEITACNNKMEILD